MYDQGFQPIREARLKRMIELGILPPGSPMAPMDTGRFKSWDDMTPERHADWTGRMQVYAAQIDHMDQQVGRLLAELQKLNIADNTLADFSVRQRRRQRGSEQEPARRGDWHAGFVPRLRPAVGNGVSNTPWRLHKTTCYEGGISTPLVAPLAGRDTGGDGRHVDPAAGARDRSAADISGTGRNHVSDQTRRTIAGRSQHPRSAAAGGIPTAPTASISGNTKATAASATGSGNW